MAAALPPSRSLIRPAYIPPLAAGSSDPRARRFPMLDLALLALGLVSFAALGAYTLLCERL